MMQRITHPFAAVIAISVAFFLAAGSVWASAEIEFDFAEIHADHGFGDMSGTGGTMGYYLDGGQTGNGVGVSITGWQARAENRTFRNRTNKLANYGSYGMGLAHNESGAEAAFDNAGRYDLVIFQFDELVSLDQIGLGWVGRDYDLSLFGHTGSTDPTLDNGTFKYKASSSKGMTNLGWELVGHYGQNSSSNITVNSASVMSSFWAIGAFTSAIIDASRTYGSPAAGNDYFTLRNLVASVQDAVAVAEPSSLELMVLALLLMVLYRHFARRRAVARGFA